MSEVKKFFTQIDTVSSRCNICCNVIKHYNNTTNLHNHIKRKHVVFLESNNDNQKKIRLEATKAAEDISNEKNNINNTLSSLNQARGISTTTATSSTSHSASASQKSIKEAFNSVNAFSENGNMTSKITNALTYMIAVDNMPLSTTEQQGFRYFMKIVSPLYKIPSRFTVTRLLDTKFTLLSERLKEQFLYVEHCTVTTDIWTDIMNTKSFLGITVHYLNKDSVLSSVTIGVCSLENSHTADYIGSVLMSTCEEWNITHDKVIAVVTDNGANMVKAVQQYYGRTKHLPCLAHTINLIVSNSLKALPDLKDIIMRVKAIVTFCKQSIAAADHLRKLQIQNGKTEGTILKLIQECETRWNSAYYMLQRFTELAGLVSMVLFNFTKPPMVTHDELIIIKEVVKMLSPFERVSIEMSSEGYVTSSKIIPVIHCLKLTLNKMTPETEVGKQLMRKLLDDIDRRFYSDISQIEKSGILTVATILDPRFKRIHFESPQAVANTLSKISDLISKESKEEHSVEKIEEHPSNSEDLDDVWNIHDTLVKPTTQFQNQITSGGLPCELKHYLDQPLINRMSDPIAYWISVKMIYPNLFRIALKYLSVVSTSVPSERLFSKAGNILTEKRNRLTGKRLSSLIFLSSLSEEQWFLE